MSGSAGEASSGRQRGIGENKRKGTFGVPFLALAQAVCNSLYGGAYSGWLPLSVPARYGEYTPSYMRCIVMPFAAWVRLWQ